jgi:hypothetical protein
MFEPFVIECPHCGQVCEILEINCSIFRCGIYKHNYQQIPPHLSKNICDEISQKGLIYGCGKPFRIVEKKVIVCDYI